MGIQIEQTTAELLPEGEYTLVLTEVTVEEGKNYNTGLPQNYLRFHFQVTNPTEFAGHKIAKNLSMTFSPKSYLYGYAKELFNVLTIPKDYTLDTEHLIGRSVLALVERVSQNNQEFNRILEVKATGGSDKPLPFGKSVQVNGSKSAEPAEQNPELFSKADNFNAEVQKLVKAGIPEEEARSIVKIRMNAKAEMSSGEGI